MSPPPPSGPTSSPYADPTGGFAASTVPNVTLFAAARSRSKRSKLIAGGVVAVVLIAAVAVFVATRNGDAPTGGRASLRAVPGPDPTKTKLKLDGFLAQATVSNGILYVATESGGGDFSTDVQAYRLGTEPVSLWHKSVDGPVRQLRVISGGLAILTGIPDSNSNTDSETDLAFKNLSDGSDLWKTQIDDQSLFDDRFSVPMLRGRDSSGGGSTNYHLLSMTEHKVTKTLSLNDTGASVVGGQLITLDGRRVRTFDATSLQPVGNGFGVDDNAIDATAVGGNFAVAEGTYLVLYDASGKEITRDNVNVGVVSHVLTISSRRIIAAGQKGTKVLDINGKNFDETFSTKGVIEPTHISGRTYGLVRSTGSSDSLVNLDSKNVDQIGSFKAGTSNCGDGEGSAGEDDGFSCNADRIFDGAIYSLNSDGTLSAYSLDTADKIYSIHTTGSVLALDGTVLDASSDSTSNSTTVQIFR